MCYVKGTKDICFTSYLIYSKYAIAILGGYYVKYRKTQNKILQFLIFYVLIGIALLLILDNAVSPDFEQKHKTLLFVLKLTYMESPILLALIINNYIAKKTKNVEK